MRVRILGPVEVIVEGTALAVRGLRRKAVLAVLALHPGEIVSTDRLIDVVWGERAPATAANTLQSHVSYLRRVLGERDAIELRPPGYVLDLGADTTDLQLAQRLIQRGMRSPDPAMRAAHLRDALALWRDRPLVDVAGVAWLEEQAERLAKIHLDAVEALTEARLACGEHLQLLPELERRCQEHPFHEHIHGHLMLALYRAGRQVEALATYQRLRYRLGDELGIDPSPVLRGLEAAILRQDPALDPPRTEIDAVQADRAGLLERESELAELAGAAREAATGAGSVVLLSGEAGIGKSSLVEAVRGVLPAAARLLVGCCDDLATPRILGPFRDLAGSVGSRLADALSGYGGRGTREEVFDALHAELNDAGTPTVLAVEDVHWADEATLDALTYLVRRVAGLPAVLLLTYRDDDLESGHPLHRVLGQAAKAARVRRLEPARLSEAAVGRLAASRRLVSAEVYSVTGGNPFFVTEIVASGDTGRIPPTIVDAVLARVHRLDPDTRAALEQLAIVPSAVDRWLLEVLLPNGIAAVAPAEERGLLNVSPTRIGFHHELIRRTVADALPTARRVQLNRQVLDALTGQDGMDPSRIMHHAAEAGDVDAIVRYGPLAADDAISAGAHREAVAHLRLVLRYRDRFGQDGLAELLSRYAIECGIVGEVTMAVAAQREAVELRRALGDRRALGRDLRSLSRLCWIAGEPELMERSADEAVTVLETAGDDRLLGLALSHRAGLYSMAYRNQESILAGERAVDLARAVDDRAILSHALTSVGGAQAQLGMPEALVSLEEALQVALAAGSVADACRATCAIVDLLLQELRQDEAMSYVTAAIELARNAEQLQFLHHLHAVRATTALAVGHWDQATTEAELVIEVAPPVKSATRCTALTTLGLVRVRRGHPGGEELLAEAWELGQRTRELQNIAPVATATAEAAWLRGDPPAMLQALEPAYAEARRLGAMAWLPVLGYWLTKAGRPAAPGDSAHPYARQAAGRWRESAEIWRDLGRDYEYAVALTEATDPDTLRTALVILDAFGAVPMADQVRRRIRSLGKSD